MIIQLQKTHIRKQVQNERIYRKVNSKDGRNSNKK